MVTIVCQVINEKVRFNGSIFPDVAHPAFFDDEVRGRFTFISQSVVAAVETPLCLGAGAGGFPGFARIVHNRVHPSFVHHHNTLEKLGHCLLNFLTTLTVVRTIIAHPNHHMNDRINLTVSNALFIAIAAHSNFNPCVIGPIDEDMVPADCFEAVCGFVYARFGFDRLRSFWEARLVSLDARDLEPCRLKGTVDGILLGVQTAFEPSDVEFPGYMARVMGQPSQPLDHGGRAEVPHD
jgi:hypothetical protein